MLLNFKIIFQIMGWWTKTFQSKILILTRSIKLTHHLRWNLLKILTCSLIYIQSQKSGEIFTLGKNLSIFVFKSNFDLIFCQPDSTHQIISGPHCFWIVVACFWHMTIVHLSPIADPIFQYKNQKNVHYILIIYNFLFLVDFWFTTHL